MTPEEIKEARTVLGLSLSQFAEMLDTDKQTARRMEFAEDAVTYRQPAPRMIRLIDAYIAGFRPYDWPKGEV